jgi:hypothetical protein
LLSSLLKGRREDDDKGAALSAAAASGSPALVAFAGYSKTLTDGVRCWQQIILFSSLFPSFFFPHFHLRGPLESRNPFFVCRYHKFHHLIHLSLCHYSLLFSRLIF